MRVEGGAGAVAKGEGARVVVGVGADHAQLQADGYMFKQKVDRSRGHTYIQSKRVTELQGDPLTWGVATFIHPIHGV